MNRKMYKVNDQEFEYYSAAVRAAILIGADVFESETGIRRWTPAPKVTRKKILKYIGAKNAYDAYQKMIAS
jgi:hypothetical protein